MTRSTANVAHSVRSRLLTLSKAQGEEFNYVLIRYALERFLLRLSQSVYRDVFILKGATLFRVWSPSTQRPTKDLHLLGYGDPEPKRIERIFAEICSINTVDDGMTFEPLSVMAGHIKESAAYEGVRVTFGARLGTARLALQVDVGFGDAVSPPPTEIELPTLLTMEAPRLRAYARETVVAEKLHAMVHLGLANSRMKDFFDVWFLSRNFDFEGIALAAAIEATFARRSTALPREIPFALTQAFGENDAKQKQWKAFVSRLSQRQGSQSLLEVIDAGSMFAWPPLQAAGLAMQFDRKWHARGPWTPSAG